MCRSLIVVAALFVLTLGQPANATPISLTFGFSSDITVPANERVDLPAVLVNTGMDPIVFDDLNYFGWGIGAGDSVVGLNPLEPIEFPPFNQFENVTLAIGQTLPFMFASIHFDPSSTTVLHPNVAFTMRGEVGEQLWAQIAVTIMVGTELEFGPLSFAPALPIGLEPIPEPATFVMMVSVGAAAGFSRLRRRLITRRRGSPS